MSGKSTHRFINCVSSLSRLVDSRPTLIKFIALLTGIKFNGNYYLLELKDFNDDQILPENSESSICYTVKIRCIDHSAVKLARMTISLVCQFYDIDLPEDVDTPFHIQDIHYERLAFIDCKATYLSKDSKSSIFLEDVRPIDLHTVINYSKDSIEGSATRDIFTNLIRMNRTPSNQFKFVKLANYNSELIQYTQDLEQSVSNQMLKENPLFHSFLMNTPTESQSQNEFNSQYLQTQPFSDESIESLSHSEDDIHDESLSDHELVLVGALNKRRKVSDTAELWTPGELLYSSIKTERVLKGYLIAVNQVGPYWYRLYLVKSRQNLSSNILLIPFDNCVEISAHKNVIGEAPWKYIGQQIDISILRYHWEFKYLKINYSSYWKLTKFVCQEIQEDALHKENSSTKTSSISSTEAKIESLPKIGNNDPTYSFDKLSITDYETKFINLIGLFVSCTFEKPNYVSMVFTDFSFNDIEQKYLFDRYIVETRNRLGENQGFRIIMYQKEFDIFDQQIRAIYGVSIKEACKTGVFGSNSENITHKGIICKIAAKIRMYNNKLNIIGRKCQIMGRNSTTSVDLPNEQKDILRKIYKNSLQYYQPEVNSPNIKNVMMCFPYEIDNAGVLNMEAAVKTQDKAAVVSNHIDSRVCDFSTKHCNIPMLDSDISSYKIIPNANIEKMNILKDSDSTVYVLDAKLLEFKYDDYTHNVDLYVTNEFNAKDVIPAQNILRIEIKGMQNLSYFLNISDCGLETTKINKEYIISALKPFIGVVFSFKVIRSRINLTKESQVVAWCPIECSVEELKCQMSVSSITTAASSNIRNTSSYPTIMVKSEPSY